MKLFLPLFAGVFLLGLAGCNVLPQPQADTARYFTLSSPEVAPRSSQGTLVRPVQLAGHLRNRAMAVRVAENEVVYLDDVRWAESLGDAMTQLLRARLGPVEGNHVINVDVQRCELVRYEANLIQLVANYTILPAGEATTVQPGGFVASPRNWDGKDYGVLVGELRAAIAELGDAIATAAAEKK